MQTITKQAFENFKTSNKTYDDIDVSRLEDALENWVTYTPCQLVQEYLKEHPNEPLQVTRDRLIVDYMIERGGLSMNEAVDLWSDWEDFEYELRNPEPVAN